MGLDIGASAVRVAQLSGTVANPSLTSFGQVALPQGAVVDGEAESLPRLDVELGEVAAPGQGALDNTSREPWIDEDSTVFRTPYQFSGEYVDEDQLELSAWARDAIALALPDQILHAPDCAGLCPVCGKDLNVEPHTHDDVVADPRWSALEELKDRL